MKKRLISLLLAFSMMLTFLPAGAVSAFAEENTIDPEKGVLLQSGDTINDKFIEEHDGATTYQMRNNYAIGVTIRASKKVTINITGNIDYNGTLFTVSNSGNVMVENNKNYTVKGGARVVSLVQGTITVNGGTYYGSSTETFLNYRYNNGVMWLNDINVITSGDNAVNNQGGKVHIKGGTYTSNSSPVIYNQTWDRYLNPGEAEQVGIMTLTDVTVESTSSGTGTGVVNSGNLTITGGKVTAPGPALNAYSAIFPVRGTAQFESMKSSISREAHLQRRMEARFRAGTILPIRKFPAARSKTARLAWKWSRAVLT